MKFSLEQPYNSKYKAAYMIDGSEGRKTIVLVEPNGKLHSTAYARYLMSVKLGRFLEPNETVDHINEDKTDDRLENLQLMSTADNIKKHANYVSKPFEHGTYRMYHRGKCRCEACSAANKEVQNRYRTKHKEEINQRRRDKRRALKDNRARLINGKANTTGLKET